MLQRLACCKLRLLWVQNCLPFRTRLMKLWYSYVISYETKASRRFMRHLTTGKLWTCLTYSKIYSSTLTWFRTVTYIPNYKLVYVPVTVMCFLTTIKHALLHFLSSSCNLQPFSAVCHWSVCSSPHRVKLKVTYVRWRCWRPGFVPLRLTHLP